MHAVTCYSRLANAEWGSCPTKLLRTPIMPSFRFDHSFIITDDGENMEVTQNVPSPCVCIHGGLKAPSCDPSGTGMNAGRHM